MLFSALPLHLSQLQHENRHLPRSTGLCVFVSLPRRRSTDRRRWQNPPFFLMWREGAEAVQTRTQNLVPQAKNLGRKPIRRVVAVGSEKYCRDLDPKVASSTV
eukprot:3882375-Rhodomonas_salina.1